MALKTLNVNSSSLTLSLSSHFYTSINALPVAKNGLPKMIGTSLSSSMSMMIKSIERINLSTFTKTSSIIPRR